MIVGISKLGTAKEFEIELIEHPFGLGELEKELLVQNLNAVTKDAFGKDVPMAETRERTVQVDSIYLVKSGIEVIGYMTHDMLELQGQKVNYFSSALLKREFQGRGLYKIMNEFRLKDNDNIIMTRTQSPVVMKGFHDLCHKRGFSFSPNGLIPEQVLAIANSYDSRAGSDMICRGVYGRELMDQTPQAVGSTRKLFNQLDVQKGDAFILIGMR